MEASTLFSFFQKNVDMRDNDTFIKQSLITLSGESWKKGYMKCLSHIKKRRHLEEKRASDAVKKLIDYISDLTHKST